MMVEPVGLSAFYDLPQLLVRSLKLLRRQSSLIAVADAGRRWLNPTLPALVHAYNQLRYLFLREPLGRGDRPKHPFFWIAAQEALAAEGNMGKKELMEE